MRDPHYLTVYGGGQEKCRKMARAAVLISELEKQAKWGGFGVSRSSLYSLDESKSIAAEYKEAKDLLLRAAGKKGRAAEREDVRLAEDLLIQLMQVADQFPPSFFGSPSAIEQEYQIEARQPWFDEPSDDFCEYYFTFNLIFQARDRHWTGRQRDGFTTAGETAMSKFVRQYSSLASRFRQGIYSTELRDYFDESHTQQQKDMAIANVALKFAAKHGGRDIAPLVGAELKNALRKPSTKSTAPKLVEFNEIFMPFGTVQPDISMEEDELTERGMPKIGKILTGKMIPKVEIIWAKSIGDAFLGYDPSLRELAREAGISPETASKYKNRLRPVVEEATRSSLKDGDFPSAVTGCNVGDRAGSHGEYGFGQRLCKSPLYITEAGQNELDTPAPVRRYTREEIEALYPSSGRTSAHA